MQLVVWCFARLLTTQVALCKALTVLVMLLKQWQFGGNDSKWLVLCVSYTIKRPGESACLI